LVAAFPDPEVEVVPSSLKMASVTTITTEKTITKGEEHTYGTSTTRGTSTSVSNTKTWGSWLDSISEEILLVKNNAGQVYWPAFNVNQIGDMLPGQGYQVYLTNPGTLIYPAN
jgi:hypothetical protein